MVSTVDGIAIAAIEAAIFRNVVQLYGLGRNHYHFARRQNNRAWRQKISRFYYGAYNVSRALRLCDKGEFSTDSSDHKKIGDVPDALPGRAAYENQLSALRDDRNLCDYDHTGDIASLVLGLATSEQLVGNFLRDARVFLISRGVPL